MIDEVRWCIRIGKERGTGPYVHSYAGGDVTTTWRPTGALSWKDRDLVERLTAVIRNVDGRHARVVRKRPAIKTGDIIAYHEPPYFRVDEMKVVNGRWLAEMTMVVDHDGDLCDYKQLGGPCRLDGAYELPDRSVPKRSNG